MLKFRRSQRQRKRHKEQRLTIMWSHRVMRQHQKEQWLNNRWQRRQRQHHKAQRSNIIWSHRQRQHQKEQRLMLICSQRQRPPLKRRQARRQFRSPNESPFHQKCQRPARRLIIRWSLPVPKHIVFDKRKSRDAYIVEYSIMSAKEV